MVTRVTCTPKSNPLLGRYRERGNNRTSDKKIHKKFPRKLKIRQETNKNRIRCMCAEYKGLYLCTACRKWLGNTDISSFHYSKTTFNIKAATWHDIPILKKDNCYENKKQKGKSNMSSFCFNIPHKDMYKKQKGWRSRRFILGVKQTKLLSGKK